MSRALSIDLRVRVLAAVSAGATHRKAGERFGVSAARPKALGGDRRSQIMEAHGAAILALLTDRRDITLTEMKATLEEKGIRVSIAGL